jgi:transcription elongation factor Elf1
VLILSCPFCRHEHADAFECLEGERADTIHCENSDCNKRFAFLIRECYACGEESVFTWGKVPTPEAAAALFCEHCGVGLNDVPQKEKRETATQRIQ